MHIRKKGKRTRTWNARDTTGQSNNRTMAVTVSNFGGGIFDPEKTLSAVDAYHDFLIHINRSELAAITSKLGATWMVTCLARTNPLRKLPHTQCWAVRKTIKELVQ